MAGLDKNADNAENLKFSLSEQREIDQKIKFETISFFHTMAKVSAFTNSFGAFLYCLIIHQTTSLWVLSLWYVLLVSANLANVLWWLRYEPNNYSCENIEKCRQGFLYIIMLICLIWGCIGILFMDKESQQLTTVIFLSAVLICFAFGTVLDVTIGLLSIICLLAPTIFYHAYLAISPDSSHSLHLAVITAFVALGLFMLAACFLGNKIVTKVFRLGYENALLSQKLENSNLLLEQRVQERTEELRKSLKLVTYQATHDLLTELPNERLLYEHLYRAMEQSIKEHHIFALVCFSLNGMVKINDSLGHQSSATITHRLAQRLIQHVQDNPQYFVALSRRDVFIIVIQSIDDIKNVETHVDRLFAILENPIYIEKQPLYLTASAGVSIFPADGRDANSLITNAEAARSLASQRGGNNLCIYNTIINADATRQLYIENYLFRAVEKNELVLNYQPFIDLRTGLACGAEALVRWKSPELGLVPPLDFIPIAESNGLIIAIGEWVLRAACQQLKQWHDLGFKTLCLSVNLSAKQLLDPNLANYISSLLEELKLPFSALELELTESNVFQKESIPIINKLADMGISLAIDDFGTGHSELSNLKLFNVNKIKIDKSFIQDVDISIDSKSIVTHTIGLAKRMNIECLAEGVETIEQIQFLKEQGCHMVQGYYFSKPLNAEQFLHFLQNFSVID